MVQVKLFAGETIWDTDVESGLVDTVGDGVGGKNWESSVDIYRVPCVT